MVEVHRLPRLKRMRRDERGVALILAIVLLVIVGAAAFVAFVSPSSPAIQTEKVTSASLAQAKEALIGYAVSRPDRPGALPCPDTDNDGLENWDVGLTACANYVGRLPWLALGLPDARDGSSERLWYALSPNYRDHAAVQPLNSDSVGQLTITGAGLVSNVVAILFSPGPVLSGQVRNATDQNNVVNYLDGENSNGDLTFATTPASATFNDRLLIVTSDAIFNPVTKRVAKELHLALERYRTANGYYPFANNYADGAPHVCQPGLQDGRIPLAIAAGCGVLADWTAGQLPTWIAPNNWNQVTHYGMDNACSLMVTGITIRACTVVFTSGRAMPAQLRPCPNAANCLEDAENSNGDAVYVKPSRTPASNDHMAVKCTSTSPCPAMP